MKTTFQMKTPIARLLKIPPFSFSKHIETKLQPFYGTPFSKIPFNNNSKKNFFFSLFSKPGRMIYQIYMLLDFISFPQPPVCLDFMHFINVTN